MQELREIFDRLADGSTGKQREALTPGVNVAVRAVAGAGKTRVLALRYVQYLLLGDAPDGAAAAAPLAPRHVAAITFTRKAAGELRRRVDEYLARAEAMAAAAPEARRHIIRCREELSEAMIGTIHAFCAALLREHALAAGLDPNFAVLDSREASDLYLEVRERFWTELSREPADSPRRAHAVELATLHGMGALNTLFDTLVRSFNLYLFSGATHEHLDGMADRDSPLDARRRSSRLGRMAAMTPDAVMAEWERLCGGPMTAPELEHRAAEHAQWAIALAATVWDRYRAAKEERSALDFEDLEWRAWELLRRNPGDLLTTLRRRYRRLLVDEFQDTSPVQWEIIQMIAGEDGDRATPAAMASSTPKNPAKKTAATKRTAHSLETLSMPRLGPGRLFIVGDPQQSIFGFRNADLRLFRAAEEAIRASNASVTFDGLVDMNDNFRSRAEVLRFVDAIMPAIQRIAFGAGAEGHGPLLETARSFQVDHLLMTPHAAAEPPGSVHLILHAHKSERNEDEEPEHSPEAEIIAQHIRALVAGDTPLRLPPPRDASGSRPASAAPRFGDIAILVRTRAEFRAFENAFLHYRIPYHIVGGRGFFQTPEITDISMLLTVLSDPANDVALAGVLRSPLFAFSDALLLRLTLAAPESAASLWDRLTAYHQLLERGGAPSAPHPARRGERLPLDPPAESAAMEAALVQLAVDNIMRWREAVVRQPLPALLHRIFEETGAWTLYRGMGRQEQAAANLEKLIGLARGFEAGGAGTLLEFVETLATLTREEEEEAEAQTQLEHADAVRLMTIHMAKGLEFPIVFLPRLGREMWRPRDQWEAAPDWGVAFRLVERDKKNRDAPPPVSPYWALRAWNDYKDMLEELRLFYVVCTRAEHHLFLSSQWPKRFADPPNSLLGLLMQADPMRPVREWLAAAQEREEGDREILPDARVGGAALTVEWWRRIGDAAADDRAVGEAAVAECGRVWFSPETWAAIQPPALPHGDVPLSVSQAALLSGCPRQWAYYRLLGPDFRGLDWGEESPLPVEEDRAAPVGEGESEAPAAARPPISPSSDRQRYGTLCHKLFELFLNAPDEPENQLAAEAFRLIAPELDAAARAAWMPDLLANLAAFRASGLGRDILASPERYAELPFFMRRDGLVVTGVIDALYRDAAGRWAVADYKTSRIAPDRIPHSASRYVPQMALTAAFVMARFPGQDVVTATLYYPFPDCAVPMEFRREDLERDLAEGAAAWRAVLTAGALEAFPFAPDWLARPQFPRSLERLAQEPPGAPAPRSEPCPVCPFLDRWCALPGDQRRVMLARKAARSKGEKQ